jgi:hypothetical protein
VSITTGGTNWIGLDDVSFIGIKITYGVHKIPADVCTFASIVNIYMVHFAWKNLIEMTLEGGITVADESMLTCFASVAAGLKHPLV